MDKRTARKMAQAQICAEVESMLSWPCEDCPEEVAAVVEEEAYRLARCLRQRYGITPDIEASARLSQHGP